MKLAIVDDDALLVQLLEKMFTNQENMQVVLTAVSGNEFLHEIKNLTVFPEIVLLELRMENGNGIEVLNRLKNAPSAPKIIILSSCYKIAYVGQMLKLGAVAFMPKRIRLQQLLNVIQEVAQTGHSWTPEQMEMIRQQLSPKIPQYHYPSHEGLTKREIEILELLCQQYTIREIADQLFLSPKTVETHKGNLMLKTGAKNMAGLVLYAIQNQIVNPEEIVFVEK